MSAIHATPQCNSQLPGQFLQSRISLQKQIIDFWNESALKKAQQCGSFVIGQGITFKFEGQILSIMQPTYHGKENFAYTTSKEEVMQFIQTLGGSKVSYERGRMD
jgi:hypothetical protein